VLSLPRNEAEVLGLVAASLRSLDEMERTATLTIGRATVAARLDDALDPIVLHTALARGERVIAQREDGVWVVLGVLRTAPTPGIDRGDEYVIEARRLKLVADYELGLVSGAATLALRAIGAIETVALDITTRAAGLNKIIGRMIRLN
jgi:hypothetical protein